MICIYVFPFHKIEEERRYIMKIAQSYVELVGHTPLVRLNNLEILLLDIELIGKEITHFIGWAKALT